MLLVFLSSAPVILLLLFIYLRDKYDREPVKQVLKILFFGMLTPIPVLVIDFGWMAIEPSLGLAGFGKVFYDSFIVAGLTEETFKFLVIVIFIWKHKEFNEKFDGIVYAMFASMGFALVENFLYVFQHGAGVGILRAFTAVPAHAMFGITMGYFFGLAKFTPEKRTSLLLASLFVPILLHGFYDFILMSENTFLLLIFLPYMALMIFLSLQVIKKHSDNSKYNPKNKHLYENTDIDNT
ncbi:MAG: PrsW family intramembrane metalloprotease [Bacteroidales bacterium]|nr:PrsW family intramembrane metalloprotease [Bacteroidales bacterium]